VSRDRVKENVYRPVSVLILSALHQPHIAFCSNRQVIVWFTDVAASSVEPLTVLGDQHRHLRNAREHLLQMAEPIAGAASRALMSSKPSPPDAPIATMKGDCSCRLAVAPEVIRPA
jgi:hypothetical protein